MRVRRLQDKRTFRLGKLINVSKSNPFGCPVCVRSTKQGDYRLEVYEFGVRFPCGCIVDLPPLHRSDYDRGLCTLCNPHLATISSIRRRHVA